MTHTAGLSTEDHSPGGVVAPGGTNPADVLFGLRRLEVIIPSPSHCLMITVAPPQPTHAGGAGTQHPPIGST
ncbi:MAG TPA: hypothetical protein VHL58_12925 [Thermoanaerobaculia bacterium]|nr:hypothetical protein [Thermoanaerobaculia bacterium]